MKIIVQIAFLALAVLTSSSATSTGDDVSTTILPPAAIHAKASHSQIIQRKKRDLSTDLLDAASSLGVGGGYLKKFNNLINGVPDNVKDAFVEQDFSNVTEADIRNLNVSVLEYIPPKLISKMNITLLNPVVERLLQANKPNALGRIMSLIGDKMDTNNLLDKIKQGGGFNDGNEEAASVLLYSALNKLGDKGGIDSGTIRRLASDGLLSLVPEEQLMKVTDATAAKALLDRVYQQRGGDDKELTDVDDKALIYKLAEVGYGPADKWTERVLKTVSSRVVSQMPADFLKKLNPEVVTQYMSNLKDTKFETPLQSKSIADSFLSHAGVNNEGSGENAGAGGGINFGSLLGQLGSLAAFVNPGLSKEPSFLNSIINACDKLNLPAPLKAITSLIRQKTEGGKKIEDLSAEDLQDMGVTVLKNGPPELIDRAIKTGSLRESELQAIGDPKSDQAGGAFGNSFLQGIISQVAAYAVKFFTKGGKIDLAGLPAAFMGALGIKGMNDVAPRDLDDALVKFKNDPDSLDDAQKALLLKKLKDAGMLDSTDLPPEIRSLLPRKKTDGGAIDILDGLPSDAELRLAHKEGMRITAADLERDKYLIGTLTPKQVNEFDIEEIPSVLAVVRKSKDGPSQQTLEALSKRFAEYIRKKSEDYDSPDKKLLKHITAAEISKLPASVLAYFIDHRQTSKLPPDVKKEIMIAMGELSTKDHATIPGKTREEIILQGLSALDSLTGGSSKKIDVPELAAIGGGVVDLPPERIAKMTPVAVEQALEIIQGTADDDDDHLMQRACLKPEQRKAWRKKIIENYGDPKSWNAPTVTALCCSVGLLDEDDIASIAADALATCRCPSDAKPPSHLIELKKSLDANCKHEIGADAVAPKQLVEKVKADLGFDLEDLEDQIIAGRRRRRSASDTLTCFQVRITGTAAPYTVTQLETLPEQQVDDCLYELGQDPLPLEHSRVLWRKLIHSKGGVGNVTADIYRYAGFVLSGIALSDVPKLDLSDPDVVSAFGRPLGVSKNILEKLATLLEEKSGKSLKEYDSSDLTIARNILCGFSAEKIMEIDSDAFRDAIPVLKNLDSNCEQTRLAALASVATRHENLGDPKRWTAADVRGAGILLIGLPESSIQSIPPESFLGMTPTVASSLPESVLSLLSPQQTSNIPRFSAQALSPTQLSAVSEEARVSLDQVVRGPLIADSTVNLQSFSFWTFTTIVLTAIFAHKIVV